jgi:hypothetical protein
MYQRFKPDHSARTPPSHPDYRAFPPSDVGVSCPEPLCNAAAGRSTAASEAAKSEVARSGNSTAMAQPHNTASEELSLGHHDRDGT